MNSCCTVFEIYPDDVISSEAVDPTEGLCTDCTCHCGYILFESLAPYITELSSNHVQDDDYNRLEAKLRQQIVEVSRLFDAETKVDSGTYSKAHLEVKTLFGNGSRYLKIPDYVNGTLELYTNDGYLINADSYSYNNGYLIFQPCAEHSPSCGCSNSCGQYGSSRMPPGWTGCLQAKANFGKECADYAVQLAVRSYIVEFNTYGDVRETNYQGLPITRGFKVPHSWAVLVQKYLENKRFFNMFGVA